MSTARDRKLTQLAGEYAVASELCRRGWTAMVMPEAWPGFDIMAMNAGGRHLRVQVKTMKKKGKRIFAPRGACPYPVVYVRLWSDRPEFFLVPGADVERLRGEEDRAYIEAHPGASTDPKVRMRTAQLSWVALEPYADRWDLILDTSER